MTMKLDSLNSYGYPQYNIDAKLDDVVSSGGAFGRIMHELFMIIMKSDVSNADMEFYSKIRSARRLVIEDSYHLMDAYEKILYFHKQFIEMNTKNVGVVIYGLVIITRLLL